MTQMDLEKKRYYIITISTGGGETKPMRAPGRREIGHGAWRNERSSRFTAERRLPHVPGWCRKFFQRFHLSLQAPRWR